MKTVRLSVTACCLAMLAGLTTASHGATAPSVDQALKLKPIQEGVEYSQPTAEEAAKCRITARKIEGQVGWIVEDADGLTLRRFVDTNGDNVVDQWSYYRDGVEVYRDTDSDFNGKADQYRWFNTGGSRWGIDKNEDGRIDAWQIISPEEVTAEVVASLASKDGERFTRLVLRAEELQPLGLGKTKGDAVAAKIEKLAADFPALAEKQTAITPRAKWVQFSGSKPGTVPAGTDGSTKDLLVYENVVAIAQVDDKHEQVLIGTLIRVGDVWRLIDLPQIAAGDVATSGFFFQASPGSHGAPPEAATAEENQKWLTELEGLDQTAERATTPEQKAEYNNQRADLLEKIAKQAKNPQDRAMWVRQAADMISAAVQSGIFPEGVARLERQAKELKESEADKDLIAYVEFRRMTAAYGLSLQAPKADFATIQTEWLKTLEQFVNDYPSSPDAAEAMLQLAIAKEFANQEDEAKTWYGRIVKDFPDSLAAIKAAGAGIRLDSVGKVIAFKGRSTSGSEVDLAKHRGKVVLLHYWATWSEPSKQDIAAIKELLPKYGNRFSVIGVNVDTNTKELADFLTKNRLTWPQVFEEGGLDSPPANRLGILTVPTLILVDQQGKVVDRSVQTAELEAAIKKLIGAPEQAAGSSEGAKPGRDPKRVIR